MSDDAPVTIVVVPRERFTCTQKSLESIYKHTRFPFRLLYVDGGSPPRVRRYLEQQARDRNFELRRFDYYLSPNEARNIGWASVDTPRVVFMDNDVVVAPGWLTALVRCADDTGADVVGPLTCQGENLHETIHCAGGEARIRTESHGEEETRHLVENIFFQGRRVDEYREQFQRQETGLAEFHCLLAETDLRDRVGLLDEGLLNTKEHVDFCIGVQQVGGRIYIEPDSLVTYLSDAPLHLNDLPFYAVRWSDEWELASLEHLQRKWGLAKDQWFRSRCRNVGWRRRMAIIRPRVAAIPVRRVRRLLEKAMVRGDRMINSWIVSWNQRRRSADLASQR